MKHRFRKNSNNSSLIFKTSIFCSLLFIVPYSCTIYNEPTKPTNVIGIDLGTTNSAVGFFHAHKGVEIFTNELGKRTTPSWVAFTSNGERLVGESAKNQASLNPENTIFDVKRLIGRKWNEAQISRDQKLYPFKLVEKDNRPFVSVKINGKEKIMSPEEISSIILLKMKNIAETTLGKEIKNVVITVPAYFSDSQKQATKDAGIIAGLNVIRIINEPTAAALAYGFEKKNEKNEISKKILVFDLGGGTFDVSLLELEDQIYDVLATSGDTHLGGEDFDQKIVEYLLKEFEKKTGMDALKDPKAISKLRRAAETAKIQLTSNYQSQIEIDSLFQGNDFSHTLSRATFEKLNQNYFKKLIPPIENVLKDSKTLKEEIDEIIMVGGSSRIPKVQKIVSDFFNGKKLNLEVNPDEAVAYGAAVQGSTLAGVEGSDVWILNIIPLSLGIETVGGVMSTILPRNSKMPTEKSQVFSTTQDGQTQVQILVYEGERSLTKHNRLLGTFNLEGIEPAPKGVPQIKVTFRIDVNGILSVSASEGENLKELEINTTKDNLSKEEIEKLLEEAKENEKEDLKIRKFIEEKIKFQAGLDQIVSEMSDFDVLDQDKIEKIENLIQLENEWLEEVDMEYNDPSEFQQRMEDLQREIQIIYQ